MPTSRTSPPRAAPPQRRQVHPAALLASGVLLVTGILGLMNGPRQIPQAKGTMQLIVSSAVLVYGVAALASLVGLWRCERWTMPVVAVWGVASVTAASVAARAYGGDSVPLIAGVGSGLGAALVAVFVAWLVRRSMKTA